MINSTCWDDWMIEFEWAILALKLIDDATLFSKEDVIKEYENNKDAENLNELLHEKSIFPNGEKLGFYNISKFTFNDFSEKKYSEKEFEEYLNGFNIEIQELFNIMNLGYSEFNEYPFMETISSINGKYKNKEDIQNIFIEKYFMFNPYFNYEKYSNFLKDILFYNFELKDNISILHVYPDGYFIFKCVNYILNQNPDCNINLYVIANNKYDIVPLKFLAILNKINFKYVVDNNRNFKTGTYNYNELFKDNETFDFVIHSNTSCPLQFTKDKIISNYGISVSSRIFYIVPFVDTYYLYKEWLENDLLESLMLIPIKYKELIPKQPTEINLHLLIVLNYNKSKERKNKFVIIDNNKNKTITTAEYSIPWFIDVINNENIYETSFTQFSNFTREENSNVISIDEIYSANEDDRDKFEISINDLLYEVKMNSQKNYYKLNYLEKDSSNKEHIVTKQLNFNIERLENLLGRSGRKNDSNKDLYFLTNKVNVDKWVFMDFELTNTTSYKKMTLNSDNVSLEYLYHYLNSQVGINEYEYFIRGRARPKRLLYNIRVPIPPKDVQDKIVEAMNKSKNFFNEVNQLKNTINNNFFDYNQNLNTINEFYGNINYLEEKQEVSISNTWEYTLSGLVWPLAITYLLATSGGFEKVETANNLLRLFEFTTAFNAIVLISGLPEEIYEQYKTRIWDFAYDKRNNNEKYVKKLKLSFGSWVEFNNLLSSAYKKEFRTDLNKEFYTNLLNKQIRKYYNNLKDERNDEFHGGITNAYDAEILINELNIPKAKIFEYLNSCYNDFKLYYITGRHNYKTKEYEVIFLNGAYSMPIYSTVTYDGFLEPESLYLHDTVENTFSKLNDELIKFKAIDETKRDWRLYIFIGFETENNTKKAIYRCYQRREDDEIEDIDLNEFM